MNRVLQLQVLRRISLPGSRHSSAWVNQARGDSDKSLSNKVDVEKLFIDQNVQSLMKDLTGLDLDNKIFKERRTSNSQRSHFALMTEERLEQTMEKMKEEGTHFLQFVPVKEPRSNEVTTLAMDEEISRFDNSKFVFTDITFDATDQDRTVVVREVDGTLRTATVEEHDRMNRIYYPKEHRPVNPPKVFENPWLQNALDRNEHEFVLDWACYFYEPDDPAFVTLSRTIFDAIVASGKYDVIHSTRHFGPFVFYLALNGTIPPLLNHFGGKGMIRECAKLIRLQKSLHPDWRVAIGSADSDEKIVNDFIKQNYRFGSEMVDLKRFMKDGTLKTDIPIWKVTPPRSSGERKHTAVSMKNVGSVDGPLGEMSADYTVKVATGDVEEVPEKEGQNDRRRGDARRRRHQPKKPDSESK